MTGHKRAETISISKVMKLLMELPKPVQYSEAPLSYSHCSCHSLERLNW